MNNVFCVRVGTKCENGEFVIVLTKRRQQYGSREHSSGFIYPLLMSDD